MARMEDGLLNHDVDFSATGGFADDIARLSPVCIGAAARACFLRIASRVFNEPRGGFQKPEVRIDGRRYGCQQNPKGN